MKLKLPNFIVNALINYAKRTPFDHLAGYMNRYWVINPKGVLSRWKTVRIHEILRSDSDRHLHDHPWPYTTIILKGGYTEVTAYDTFYEAMKEHRKNGSNWERHDVGYLPCRNRESRKWEARVYYGAGSVLRRAAGSSHRLIVEDGKSATTLFIMGAYENKWGFHTPEGKIYWRDYLDAEDVTKRAKAISETYQATK